MCVYHELECRIIACKNKKLVQSGGIMPKLFSCPSIAILCDGIVAVSIPEFLLQVSIEHRSCSRMCIPRDMSQRMV